MSSAELCGNGASGPEDGIENLSVLNVLLVYEDLPTGLRARCALERAVRGLPVQADFHINLIRIDLLGATGVLPDLIPTGEQPDIVFVSAHGRKDLSSPVRVWLRDWVSQTRGEPAALVISLDEGVRESAPANRILDGLQSITTGTSVDLFPHFGPGISAEEDLMEDLQNRAMAHTALLEGILNRPEAHAHGGFNRA